MRIWIIWIDIALMGVMSNIGMVIIVGNMRNRLKKTIEKLKIEVLIGCSWYLECYATPTYVNLELRDFQISPIRLFVLPVPDEISNFIEEVDDLSRQINLEVNSDDVQVLLDSRPGTDNG
ncbi:hypothetical protein TNCV_365881 [Trichonephila clavipes]|nr:hypothetical protein TNCV_365881 [Trichonephila clavipes]